jgi:hypothetical protein
MCSEGKLSIPLSFRFDVFRRETKSCFLVLHILGCSSFLCAVDGCQLYFQLMYRTVSYGLVVYRVIFVNIIIKSGYCSSTWCCF